MFQPNIICEKRKRQKGKERYAIEWRFCLRRLADILLFDIIGPHTFRLGRGCDKRKTLVQIVALSAVRHGLTTIFSWTSRLPTT